MNRSRRKEEVERAYQIQVEAGLRGAAQYGAVGLGLAAVGHYAWPAFRCVSIRLARRGARRGPGLNVGVYTGQAADPPL